MAEQFENNYRTQLNGAIDDNDTTITVDTPPDSMTGSFRIRIDDEIILVNAVSGNDFTGCTRGVEGTVAASHQDNAIVRHVLTAESLLSIAGSGDVIEGIFGTPDTAFEFDTTSLTGLTALGSADVESADTTIPSHLYLKDLNGAYAPVGRYLTAPSAPFTIIAKLNVYPFSNYNTAGIFIGAEPLGNMDSLAVGENGGTKLALDRNTPTAYGSNVFSIGFSYGEVYLSIRVNSSSNVDYAASTDGKIWRYLVAGRNPSITIANIGLHVKAENGTHPGAAAFDFFRVWESALSYPGL